MTESTQPNFPGKAIAATTLRDIISLRLQVEMFQRALEDSKAAAEALYQRQIAGLPLSSEPGFTANLVHDVLANNSAVEGLSFHAEALLDALRRLLPAQSASTAA